MATKLKSSFELTDAMTAPPTPPAEPSNPLHEALAAEVAANERHFRAEAERLRAAGMALGERRRPATAAVDQLRRLVEVVGNGRRYLAAAKARADVFHTLVIGQLGGGGGDLNLINNIADNDPPAASAERLVGILSPWLESREQELRATITEARKLVQSAPDNSSMLIEVEQLAVSIA